MTFDAYDRLGTISARTFVVTGTEDVVVDPRNSGLIHDLIPDAAYEELPSCGHLFFWERPEAFVRVLRFFLEDE
jgi:pimeloyl-ACP methyl ester carboxylesterase